MSAPASRFASASTAISSTPCMNQTVKKRSRRYDNRAAGQTAAMGKILAFTRAWSFQTTM